MKEHDILYFENVYLYKQGKWAERVKERVKVKNYSYRTLKGNNPEIYHECTFKCSIKEFDDDVQIFLASQLEKYLNGEIE